jgi:hypothetical protein
VARASGLSGRTSVRERLAFGPKGWLLTISLPAVFHENVNRAGKCGQLVGRIGERLPQEDALRAGPLLRDRVGVSKMCGASGKKLPYQRLELRPSRMCMLLALQIEAEGGAGFVLAVDADEVLWLQLRLRWRRRAGRW